MDDQEHRQVYSEPPPVTAEALDPREVARQVLAHHRFTARRVVQAAASFNTVFRVETDAGPFALRVPAALQIHTSGSLEVEGAWLERLRRNGVPVPVPVRDDRGRVGTEIATATGRLTCALFTWVPGRTVRTRLSAPKAAALGQLSAQLHEDAASWAHEHVPDVLRADTVTYWRLPRLLTEPSTPFREVFSEAAERVQVVLDELWAAPPHQPHLLHADLHPSNTVLTRTGALVAIDFQDLTWGFEVQDLAITISSLRRLPAAARLTEVFTAGCVSRRAWPVTSPEVLEAVVVARTLNQVNLVLNVHGTAGRERQLAERAATVRAWLDALGGHRRADRWRRGRSGAPSDLPPGPGAVVPCRPPDRHGTEEFR